MENENLLSRLQRRATIAVVLLGLCAVADLAAVAFDAGDHHLVNKLRAGASVSLAAAATADNRVRDLGVIQIVLFIATAIAFIAWFSLAYRNLERLFGVLLRWDKGWAIGAWFVPILSLVRPKRIANFIWRGSDPSLPANFTSPGDAGTPVPWFYNWWWGAFLVSAFAARIGSVMQRNAKTLPSLGSALTRSISSPPSSRSSSSPRPLDVSAHARRFSQDRGRCRRLPCRSRAGSSCSPSLPGSWSRRSSSGTPSPRPRKKP